MMTTHTGRLQIGEKAPELTLRDAAASQIQLGDLWGKEPLMLAFLRHYG
ncbi:MAG: hypothetical protein ACR2PL_16320 [Dehalococcoidia bacterium]